MLLKIYERKEGTRSLFLQDMIPFLSQEQKEIYLSKVPEAMQIEGMNARTFLSKEISAINFMQTKNFTRIHDGIIAGLHFKLPSEYDGEFKEKFDASYHKWNGEPFKKANAERVKEQWGNVIAQYEKLKGKFDEAVHQINELRHCANGIQIVRCRLCFSKIRNENDTKIIMSVINDELLSKLKEMKEKQKELAGQLIHLQSIISKYNIQRTIWARFLIGTEKTPRWT